MAWVTLYTRYGNCIQSPTEEQLRAALAEVFSQKDAEHPDAWIECGINDGPLRTFSVFEGGRGLYVEYSDADMEEELSQAQHEGLNPETALNAWRKLIADVEHD